MKDKKNIIYLVISIILFIIALGFCLSVFVFDKSKTNGTNEIIETMEVSKTKNIENVKYNDITLYKADNTEIKLSDYKDSAIVLLFFNKDTEDSIQDLKKVEEIYKNYEEKIKFFVINTSQEIDEELQKEYSLEFYYDFYKEAARTYNVTELPSIIYITENNEVFNAKSGFTTSDALEANLDILSNNI